MIPLTYVPVYAQVSQYVDSNGPVLYGQNNDPGKTVARPVPGSQTVQFIR